MVHNYGASNTFDRASALQACVKARRNIVELRADRRENIILKLMEPRKKYFFFGKLVSRTRDEAEEFAKDHEETYWAIESAACLCSDQDEMARVLLDVAICTLGDTINLTTYEFSAIAQFYGEKVSH